MRTSSKRTGAQNFYVFLSTFIIALLFTIIPIPVWAAPYRPEWVLLMIIYWSMTTPRFVGVGRAWFIGLLMDVSRGALLGQHALGFALTAYISIRFHHRMRIYSLPQQALFIALIMLPYLSTSLWVYGALGQDPKSWTYWAPALSSAILWPWIYMLMRAIRKSTNME